MHRLLDQISTWFNMINWQDTRVILIFIGIEVLAGGYLIFWAASGLRRSEPEEPADDPGAPQQPETDVFEMEPDEEPVRFWARVRNALFGEEPEGATEDSELIHAITARRGRVSGDMGSLVDVADWHDRLRDVAVRFEEALDANLLDIGRRFGFYDEMLQALAATHVHIPDSIELDDAAAPIVELLEADTMSWTATDQDALEELLAAESHA